MLLNVAKESGQLSLGYTQQDPNHFMRKTMEKQWFGLPENTFLTASQKHSFTAGPSPFLSSINNLGASQEGNEAPAGLVCGKSQNAM